MEEKEIDPVLKIPGLSPSEILVFRSLGQVKTIPKKTILLPAGAVADKAYFILSGAVRHYTQDKTEQFTKNLMRGPTFVLPSLTSFFLQIPSINYCESLTEMKVIEWDRKAFMKFADEHPNMYKFLLKAVVNAFRKKEVKEIAFNTQVAEQRYQRFLEEQPGLINEIPIQYVASFLGVRPETLSRIRAKRIS